MSDYPTHHWRILEAVTANGIPAMNMNSQPQPMSLPEWEPTATERAELLHGYEYPLRCQATTADHARACFRVATLLEAALRTADRQCTVRTEGPLVDINGFTAHIPDVSVECGSRQDIADTHIKPCIVVEVMSPGTRSYDMTTKLTSYMQFVSYINDYLLVDLADKVVIHYSRSDESQIIMQTLTVDDIVRCQDIGIAIRIADIFTTFETP